MATLKLYRDRLRHNYNHLNRIFEKYHKDWAIVTKLLCGNELFLKEVLDLGITEVCDSRLSNLKKIKEMSPKTQTVYIKPPPKRSIKTVVKYADVSFNSESSTIKMLSEEAQRQNKVHRITIMIELGDLREGIMGENLIDFYNKVFDLPNIEIVAIGANVNCLHGVMPSQDKLIQLSLYKQLVEASFQKKIKWVTGGSSVTIPLLRKRQVPQAINHFRIGETLYFGLNLSTGKTFSGMKSNVFRLFAEILEITDKPKIPIGELAENPYGEVFEIDEADYGKTSYRAIIDIGSLDISPEYLIPEDKALEVVNASSDMLIIDIGKTKRNYRVGGIITFTLKYMGVLHLMNSDYIEKEVV